MNGTDFEDIKFAIEEARAHRGNQRAMRVVLECAHIRLMPYIDCLMGIGASTRCTICPDEPTRLVVDTQETGILDKTWEPR